MYNYHLWDFISDSCWLNLNFFVSNASLLYIHWATAPFQWLRPERGMIYCRQSLLQRHWLHSDTNLRLSCFKLTSTDFTCEHNRTLYDFVKCLCNVFNIKHHYNQFIVNNNNNTLYDIHYSLPSVLWLFFWVTDHKKLLYKLQRLETWPVLM